MVKRNIIRDRKRRNPVDVVDHRVRSIYFDVDSNAMQTDTLLPRGLGGRKPVRKRDLFLTGKG